MLMTTAARSSDPYPANITRNQIITDPRGRGCNSNGQGEKKKIDGRRGIIITGAVEAEEEGEREEDGAEDERRHGCRHAGAPALGRRSRSQVVALHSTHAQCLLLLLLSVVLPWLCFSAAAGD